MKTKFCKRHTTYAARRPPKSDCELCWIAYRREKEVRRIVTDAADRLSKELQVSVVLEARYRRIDSDNSGIRVEVYPTGAEAIPNHD